VSLLKLGLFMILLGGAGGVLGAVAGNALGRGGVLGGGLVGGLCLISVGGVLAARWHWISPAQRLWAILGGAFGVLLAFMVVLSTLSSPIAPVIGTLLIGAGAVLGAVVGNSPHAQA
jgi:hypothetical protein